MQTISFSCDRCRQPVEKEARCRAQLGYQGGKQFDLRDEDFDLCPDCYNALIHWVTTYDQA